MGVSVAPKKEMNRSWENITITFGELTFSPLVQTNKTNGLRARLGSQIQTKIE